MAAEKKRKAEEAAAREVAEKERREREDADDRAAAKQRALELRDSVVFHRQGQQSAAFRFLSYHSFLRASCSIRPHIFIIMALAVDASCNQ